MTDRDCDVCGAQNAAERSACRVCAQPLGRSSAALACPTCGHELPGGVADCPACGEPASATDERPSPLAALGAASPSDRALPPIPDGGLAATMPDWLRAAPEAPPAATVPAALISADDLPPWLHALVARDRTSPGTRTAPRRRSAVAGQAGDQTGARHRIVPAPDPAHVAAVPPAPAPTPRSDRSRAPAARADRGAAPSPVAIAPGSAAPTGSLRRGEPAVVAAQPAANPQPPQTRTPRERLGASLPLALLIGLLLLALVAYAVVVGGR